VPDDAYRFMLILNLAQTRISIARRTGKLDALQQSHQEVLKALGYTNREKTDFYWSVALKTLADLDLAIGLVEVSAGRPMPLRLRLSPAYQE
jgi:hypothetical protein